jgi:hypothetical protein
MAKFMKVGSDSDADASMIRLDVDFFGPIRFTDSEFRPTVVNLHLWGYPQWVSKRIFNYTSGTNSLVDPHMLDGRLLFAIPKKGASALGPRANDETDR